MIPICNQWRLNSQKCWIATPQTDAADEETKRPTQLVSRCRQNNLFLVASACAIGQSFRLFGMAVCMRVQRRILRHKQRNGGLFNHIFGYDFRHGLHLQRSAHQPRQKHIPLAGEVLGLCLKYLFFFQYRRNIL